MQVLAYLMPIFSSLLLSLQLFYGFKILLSAAILDWTKVASKRRLSDLMGLLRDIRDLRKSFGNLVDATDQICIGRFFSLEGTCKEKISSHELPENLLHFRSVFERRLVGILHADGQGLINYFEFLVQSCSCPKHRDDFAHLELHVYFWLTTIVWGNVLTPHFLEYVTKHGARLDIAGSYGRGYITRDTIEALPIERAVILYKGTKNVEFYRPNPCPGQESEMRAPLMFKNWLEGRKNVAKMPGMNDIEKGKYELARHQWDTWHIPRELDSDEYQISAGFMDTGSIIYNPGNNQLLTGSTPKTSQKQSKKPVSMGAKTSVSQTTEESLVTQPLTYRYVAEMGLYVAVPRKFPSAWHVFNSHRYHPESPPQRWDFHACGFRPRGIGMTRNPFFGAPLSPSPMESPKGDLAFECQRLLKSPPDASHTISKVMVLYAEGLAGRLWASAHHSGQRILKGLDERGWASLPKDQKLIVNFALSVFITSRLMSIIVRVLPPHLPTSLLLDALMLGTLLVALPTEITTPAP